MKYSISQINKKTIVQVSGFLNEKEILDLERDLHAKMSGSSDLVFECRELDYISSTCIRFMLILHNEIRAKGGKMTINNLQPDLQKMIQWAGFEHEFTFTQDN